jgi:ATP-dependent helicase HrpB
MCPRSLPIDEVLPELVTQLSAAGCAVLVAPTGAGKTTRVPPALLDAGLAGDGAVVMLEPRRLAARAAARRMAHERGGRVGDEVGYRVRFDSKVSRATRIEVVTEGLFVRRLQSDPFLTGVGAVVFDEFHERHLDGDLALAMVRRLRHELRPELPLLIMSATLDAEAIAAALDCPVVSCEGRSFPVEIAYLPGPAEGRLAEQVRRGVRAVLLRDSGDVLVFLPGLGAIAACETALADMAQQSDLHICRLHGDLPGEQQDAVLLPGPRRKLILATNVAETSITIEGVTAVVDTGLARIPDFDPAVGLDRLTVQPISKASADQRAGRAGRTAAGFCARLWTLGQQQSRPELLLPEIQRLDLAGAVLQLRAWGEPDPAALPWLEPPGSAALARADQLLQRLGAWDGERVTDVGQALSRLPLPPRLGRLGLEGARLGVTRRAALACALLSEKDPAPHVRRATAVGRSDLIERVAMLEAFAGGRRGGRSKARSRAPAELHRGAANQVLRVAEQLTRLLVESGSDASRLPDAQAERVGQPGGPRDEDALLGRALLAAFPDRLARRREPGSDRGVMVGGRGVRLDPASIVRDEQLFLCLSMEAGSGAGAEALVRMASGIERDWLPEQRITTTETAVFDRAREVAGTVRRVQFDDLVLEQHSIEDRDQAGLAAVLEQAARADLASALNLDDKALAAFRERVSWLAEWMPELDWPGVDDTALAELLPSLCAGRRSFAELRRAPLLESLRGLFGHSLLATLEREAPERLGVPSGSRIALRYERGRAPVLAVRIQELFGLAETPRLARGKVPVVLHLLGPNMREQQVTDDLASFWSNTYPLVRKELRRRYPKHSWPEDPLSARPQGRSGRRPRR